MFLVMIATQAELMNDDFNACLSYRETETRNLGEPTQPTYASVTRLPPTLSLKYFAHSLGHG